MLPAAALFGQDSTLRRNASFKTTIRTTNGEKISHVYLADLNDTAAIFMRSYVRFRSADANAATTSIPYSQIESATLRRKGSIGKGILIGTLGGAIIGRVIAGSSRGCRDCATGRFITFAGTFAGALGGGFLGLLTGAILENKQFSIGGKKEKFDKMKLSVLDRAYYR